MLQWGFLTTLVARLWSVCGSVVGGLLLLKSGPLCPCLPLSISLQVFHG